MFKPSTIAVLSYYAAFYCHLVEKVEYHRDREGNKAFYF